jgi:hypothetical protein
MSKTDKPIFFLQGFGVKKKYLYMASDPINVGDGLRILIFVGDMSSCKKTL